MRPFLIVLLSTCSLIGCGSTPATPESSTFVERAPIEGGGATLVVRGLSCPLCATNVDKQLKSVPGVASATVDLGTGEIVLGFSTLVAAPSRSELRRAIVDAGYTLESIRVHKGG